jgi:hypothetical protein
VQANQDRLRIECLVLAQTFETLWAYYLQSSGHLFAKECRSSALTFLDAFDVLATMDLQLKENVALYIGQNTEIEEILANNTISREVRWAPWLKCLRTALPSRSNSAIATDALISR